MIVTKKAAVVTYTVPDEDVDASSMGTFDIGCLALPEKTQAYIIASKKVF